MSDLREAIAAAIHRAVCPIGVDAEGHDHCGRLAAAILARPEMVAALNVVRAAKAAVAGIPSPAVPWLRPEVRDLLAAVDEYDAAVQR